jgi:hypothetical protein
MAAIRVKATKEGLIGKQTSAGLIIRPNSVFVALPSTRALWKVVRVTTGSGDKSVVAPVLDVGPWNERDHDYVFGTNRPAAETGPDERGRTTNRAGIDLSEGVCKALGWHEKQGDGIVEWEFLT